ncbi:MAG: nucleotidyltransferase domain-containing protein, partial [Bacteroidales bacterium]|nr:nucleotidyltransferase domain-containing protein [Bacteroidales bacterium]
MESIGEYIRRLRENKGEPLRKVAAYLDVDQAILSKIERGKRKATKQQVVKLAKYFGEDKKKMLIVYLSERILYEVQEEDYAKEALKVAEERIEYMAYKTLDRDKIIKRIKNRLKQFSKVSSAWIYGSFSREDDRPGSDIDIAIKTDNGFSYFDLAEIQYQLENEVNRKIDVGFIDSFKPHIFRNVEQDLKLIYE